MLSTGVMVAANGKPVCDDPSEEVEPLIRCAPKLLETLIMMNEHARPRIPKLKDGPEKVASLRMLKFIDDLIIEAGGVPL